LERAVDHLIENEPEKQDVIQTLEHEAQNIEIELAPYVREINFKQHMANVNTQKVLEKLPAGHALLEYGWFHYTKSTVDTRNDVESGGRYYVYLLRDDKVTLHYLDDTEEPIHKYLEKSRQVVTKIAAMDDAKEALSKLYSLLIAPYTDNLQGIEHLYIAPDGELYKLPFELLLDEKSTLLSDKFSISYLSSGRDLARPKKWNMSVQEYQSVAILADPLYDLPGGCVPTNPDVGNNKTDRGISRQSHDVNDLEPFEPLPNTKKEANVLHRIFTGSKKEERCGASAKKDSLGEKEIASSNIIHIATHGFALERQELPDNQLDILLGNKLKHGRVKDPLTRCGLAFAGVNDWLKSDKKKMPIPEYGNGILNAKDVLALDLRETDLLVLSACQTGLGEVRNGEGIQGLRRAFELAGVNTLICTLWDVDDIASAILMEQFYVNLLDKRMDKLQALSSAKEYIKCMTCSDQLDFFRDNDFAEEANELSLWPPSELDKKPYVHPYFWAGYILQGDTNRP